jgi:hypothetical protein
LGQKYRAFSHLIYLSAAFFNIFRVFLRFTFCISDMPRQV